MKRITLIIALFFTTSSLLALPLKTSALSGSSFRSGRIIDDSIFVNKDSMTAGQIQDFLNSKLPSCDRNHASTNPSYQPPYTCLNEYLENTTTGESNYGRFNPDGSPLQISGGKSAAQIIWDAGQAYGINPQVLIVLLQKEQSLITDNWPWLIQYQKATGYLCPDTAPCDSGKAGFYRQVDGAAWQFRHDFNGIDTPNYYAPYGKGWNNVRYSPNAACGTKSVFIETQATAVLYKYTPYTPNDAALNNLYGSGDACSAYGNRNFWRLFNEWFGSSIISNLPGCDEATNTARSCIWSMYNPSTSDQFLTSSIPTRDDLYLNQGYQYIGKAFFGNVIPLAGNVPVYRASVPGGGSFLTTSKPEYDSLVASGYIADGIDFYTDPAGSNSGYPVYRLYNPNTFKHYWTADISVKQTYIQSGYNDEGIAFTSISPVRQEVAPPTGKMLVYRFYIPQTYSHFWTTDVNERDEMIKAGYQYERVAWLSSSNISDQPVYRLYAPAIRQHLYTTSLPEKNDLAASGGWIYEGISQFVSKTVNSSPVYRLYAPSLGVHLVTADANERNVLLSSGKWNNEGVAWYQAQ